jgi:rubrerythrin
VPEGSEKALTQGLHLRMRRAVAADHPRKAFEALAEQEQQHLELLTNRLVRSLI